MTVEVRAPAEQSEGTRSEIVRWLKSPGEPVARDEPLIEVETDKVTVEIAAPATGVLREILKQAHEEIAPGELLGRIDTDAARVSPAAAPLPQPGTPRRLDAAAADRVDAAARRADEAEAARMSAEAAARMSPAVKRLLSQHGIDPSGIRGTGQAGRITVDDVVRHAAQAREPASAAGAPASEARESLPKGARAAPEPAGARDARTGAPAPGSGRLIPHSAVRKRIAEHMVRSLLQTAPHVTTVFEADFSAVLAHRERHRERYARQGVPLTLTAYILAACVDAIHAVPEANARWTDEALEIFDRMDIGVATALPERGLIVPVVRNVQDLTLEEIARELDRLVRLAREDRLTPEDVRGGTFTISNHGVSGSLLAAPIVINQPQSAILGVGKVEKRPVVVEQPAERATRSSGERSGQQPGEERIVARPRCFITLTIDHRVMDGHRANRFLEVLVRRLENWPSE